MKYIALTPAFAVLLATIAPAELITVEFEMEASTVVGQPFGIDVPRLTRVDGFFTYESDTADQLPADLRRGNFQLSGSWDLRAEFLGHAVTGSALAAATTETFGHTFRINDGDDREDTGDMAFDDITASDIRLSFSFTGDEVDLPTDQLPERFRFEDSAHTCVIGDDSGRMLLQFLPREQRSLPKIKTVSWDEGSARIVWCSLAARHYSIEFSTDLQTWRVIAPSVIGLSGTTAFSDRPAERLELVVPRGFYRVRLSEPP